MPQTAKVIETIENAAKQAGLTFQVLRQGGNHTIYSLDGLMIPVARHPSTDGYLEVRIYKQAEPKLGKGWWRKK